MTICSVPCVFVAISSWGGATTMSKHKSNIPFPVYVWQFPSMEKATNMSNKRATICKDNRETPVDFIQCNVIHTVMMTRQRVLY